MHWVRQHLAPLVVGLFVAQLAGVFAAPVAITCRAQALEAAAADCCAMHGPGAVCPMEKARQARRDGDCRLAPGGCQDETALVSILGVTGVLAQPPQAPVPLDIRSAPGPGDETPASRDLRPHNPPPRA